MAGRAPDRARAAPLRPALRGVNLFLADGEAAFQEIPHVHLHVFPRYAGDSFRLDADWQVRDRAELDAAAGAVRTGLTALGDDGGVPA